MIARRLILNGAFALAALVTMPPARAANVVAFDQAAFETAKSANKSVLVEVTAPWCPTCKAQKQVLGELFAKPEFANLTVFEVDFDSRKDVLRTLDVRQQSTLIAYKGKQEKARSTGETGPAALAALLAKTR
ncbi:thioredoxin [Rhodoblastus acidophilus]|jgi:thioredoxin 1|uniref:Thioredoxin n=1 Tax=Rhodoblastus acidophilus TaxID=1074 RepID=A0A6N8DQ61_RHOAC|nr:thioredoxin family protein [Rhodoblastus acidophilus]MCW2273729.1 thiol-disulfide isomerase/thioredoxin [Rhodoblastus acidophilus]MTV32710.1 thioredoxin [Rhodoblastus acidophilus]